MTTAAPRRLDLTADDLTKAREIGELFSCDNPGLLACAYRAGMIAGIKRSAEMCKQAWQGGYRGEVTVGFANIVLSQLDHRD